jgi:hypothetical protein
MLLFAEQSSRRLPPGSVPIHFDLRGYSSLFYLRRKPTRSLRSPISSDAFLATLVHAPFCYVIRSSPSCAFLRAAARGAIRSLRWWIAATRVTMPYGNTLMGCELLRACFQDRPHTIGDVRRLAQRGAFAPTSKDQSNKDQFLATLDGMADVLSPRPIDWREHMSMCQLIGDPLLPLHPPTFAVAQRTTAADNVK